MPRAACWIGLLAMTVSVVAGATVSHAEDPLKVAVARRGSWETAIAEIGTRAGIFKKHNLSLASPTPRPPAAARPRW
jgi:NitT/TauT family transport system substrate-binding protein